MKTLLDTSAGSKGSHLMKTPVYDRILVPTDFSPLSLCAVKTALDLLEGNGNGAIFLIHVVDPIPPLALVESGMIAADDLERRVAEAERELSLVAHDYSSGIQIAFRVIVGSPETEISNMALHGQFDVIALTSHGRSGFPRMLLGSTAEAVLRQAHTPVLVIRPSTTQSGQFDYRGAPRARLAYRIGRGHSREIGSPRPLFRVGLEMMAVGDRWNQQGNCLT